MAKAIFHPQAWINDYAVEVDPEGPTEWEVGDVPDDLQDDDYPSDNLRYHDNAPAWVKEWSGPFYIEIVREKRFVDCGICGAYHRADYHGDCRNDDERYHELPNDAVIVEHRP